MLEVRGENKYKAILLTACLVFMLCSHSSIAKANTLGDVSGNSQITLYDASLVLQYLAGNTNLTSAQLAAAQVDGSGQVTANDANLIAQYVLGLITQFPASASYSVTTPQGLTVTLTPSGIQALSMNGTNLLVSSGSWAEANASDFINECGDVITQYDSSYASSCQNGTTYPSYPNEIYVNTAQVTQSIVQTGTNTFVVTHTYPNATFTYNYTINGEDIIITTTVQNNSSGQSFYNLRFGGLNFNFTSPLGNEVLSWANIFWQDGYYLQQNGRSLFHPSYFNPIGAWYMRNNYFGVGINPLGAYDTPNMLWPGYWTSDNGLSTPQRSPIYLLQQSIGPGQSGTNSLDIRISNNVDLKHLLAPYQQDYNKQYPSTLYQTDVRPIAYTAEADASWVTPTEPYGFQVSREWDNATVSQQYLAGAGVYIQSLGVQGVIDWSPQGMKAIMYTPAIDEFPDIVATNLNTILIPGYHNLGYSWGLGSRPGNDILDGPATTSTDMVAVDPTNPASLAHIWNRFNTTIQMGARLFYEDSFPMNYNDTLTLRYLRGQMNATGNNIQSFSEFGTDISLPFGGFYKEINTTSTNQFYLSWMDGQNESLALEQWLMPQMGVVARPSDSMSSSVTNEQAFTWSYAHKVSPLLFDWDPNEQLLVPTITALNAQYIDPVTHTWKASAFPTPAVPENVTASKASSTQINLTWTEDPGDTTNQVDLISFVIQRSLDGGNTWQNLVTLMKNQTNFTTAYSDTNLTLGQTYTYRIQAISDFNGYSTYSNPASVSL